MTVKRKDRYALAHSRFRSRDRMPVQGTASADQMKQTRCQSDAGVEHELHERAPKEAVHVVTAAVVLDGHDGLCSLRILCKPRPFVKLTGMIDADHVPVSHVSGTHQLGCFFHEVIIMSIDGERRLESCTLCSEFETSIENCMLSV